MSRRAESELQIELTKLQIEHEKESSLKTILISMLISLSVTTMAVYVPLSIANNSAYYFFYGLVVSFLGLIPVFFLVRKLEYSKKDLDLEIENLKKKYLW